MSTSPHDWIILGGGIVGTACAEALARDGARVLLLEARGLGTGVTAAGMGHLVVMDDSEAQMRLSHHSRELWRARASSLPAEVEYDPCGTLWVATNEAEMAEVEAKHARYAAAGIRSERVSASRLREVEPSLADGLAGGLRVPDDAVVYPPAAALYFAHEARLRGADIRVGAGADRLEPGEVVLKDGSRLRAKNILVATGVQASELLPELPVRPRKGHLVITERHPGFARHQIVEMGYLTSAYGSTGDTVAFNLQPRKTGQMLLGSSRLYDDGTPELRASVVSRMIARARVFLPGIGDLTALRAWTGLRPATPDKLPIIGPVPGRPGVWAATGHEGLGITNATGTADLIACLATGRTPPVDPTPTLPDRFVKP